MASTQAKNQKHSKQNLKKGLNQGKRLHYRLIREPFFFVRTSRGSKHLGIFTGFSIWLRLLKSIYLQAGQTGPTFAGGPIVGALCDIEPQPDQSLIAISRRTLVHQIMLVVINQPSFFTFFNYTAKKSHIANYETKLNFLPDLVHSLTKF